MVEISSCQVLSRFTHEFDGPLTCTRLFRCSLIFSSTCPINAHLLLKLLFLWCIFFIIMMNLRVEGEPEEAPACLPFPRVTKPDTSELAPLHLCVTYSLGSSKVKHFSQDCPLIFMKKYKAPALQLESLAIAIQVFRDVLNAGLSDSMKLPLSNRCKICLFPKISKGSFV